MKYTEKKNKRNLKLEDIYDFADDLRKMHPDKHHINEKKRRQLQILRDKNYLNFLGGGYYASR